MIHVLLEVGGGALALVFLTLIAGMVYGHGVNSNHAEVVEARYRIHEIVSTARAAMWDEVQRRRPGGS